VHGMELWRSNGTWAGTKMVRDINPGPSGSGNSGLVKVGKRIFFQALHPTKGRELYVSNGKKTGTWMVKDIMHGAASSSPTRIVSYQGRAFFIADDGTHGVELWKSNGTKNGTSMVRDLLIGSGSPSIQWLVPVGKTLYFRAKMPGLGYELFRSNGSKFGTKLVKEIHPGDGGSGVVFLPIGLDGKALFNGNDGGVTTGEELWTSDGTKAGTKLVKDIRPGATDSRPYPLQRVGDTLYFGAYTASDYGLWKTKGKKWNTKLVRDHVFPAEESARIGKSLFFAGERASDGVELWKTSDKGAFRVKDINPGVDGSYPDYLTRIGKKLFFRATDGSHGQELWVSKP
jgi:ELWxxDGT repeat protein